MACMIDPIPTYHGESKLWNALHRDLPNSVVVYNGREINGREFDFCLLIENCGILIIEVKGWLSDKIQVQGIDQILVEGYAQPQRSPKKQSRAYRFALLNKITEKHNISPLVFDMVCYPFISKSEYQQTHLDIISEENLTLFKEDLENTELLHTKLKAAYLTSNIMPHTDFTRDVLNTLRQDWEPDFVAKAHDVQPDALPYSRLSVYPDNLPMQMQSKIVDEYFCGVKRIVFLRNSQDFHTLVDAFDQAFQEHKVQPSNNRLSFGYTDGFQAGASSARAFNLEIYALDNLADCCPTEVHIDEGCFTDDEEVLLTQLASLTTFNLSQYKVEHACSEHNILVEAGAGTGKTFSMVSRVAYLCNKLSGPVANIADEIAMLTFTNDAAINMKTRLKQMFVNYYILTSNAKYLKFVEDTDRAHISTIHSFALDLIREASLYTGLGTDFRVSSNEYLRSKKYDEYLSQFLEQMESENPSFINQLPVPVYDLKKKLIGLTDQLLTKNTDLSMIQPCEMGIVSETAIPYFNDLLSQVAFPAELAYLSEEHLTNDVDLKECIILLDQVLARMGGKLTHLKLRYLFVDEFQDTDDVQIIVFQKVQKAMQAQCHFFVVGDLKQSIYRFRGAKLSAFKQLMSGTIYPWDSLSLTINYRTDCRLLDQYDLIFHSMGSQKFLPYDDKDRLTSTLTTDAAEQNLLVEIPCHGKEEEQFFETVLKVIRTQMAITASLMESKSLSKEERTIAILVRSNWQVDRIVAAAKEEGLSIETKSGGDLFQLVSTQDLYKLLAALNYCHNPIYLVNLIESNYIKLPLEYSKYHGMSAEEITADLIRILDEFFAQRMNKTWHQLVNATYTQPILHVIKQIYDALEPWKNYSYEASAQKYYMANYAYLLERIIQFSRIDTLTLNQVAEYLKVNIVTGQKVLSREIDMDDDGIHLLCTTIHKSKGLEYGTVILPYTSEDISDIRKVKLNANYLESELSYSATFDNKIRIYNSTYQDSKEVEEQIADESRILYVALTRAIRSCIWIHNLDRHPTISWASFLEN